MGLSDRLRGNYRVLHRRAQAASGPAFDRGQDVLMYETFGNEAFFAAIGLHEVLNNVDPASAIALGAQVDLTRVPAEIVAVMIGDDLDAKDAALADPATTRALITAPAVIRVKGVYMSNDPADDEMIAAGLTCSLCHVNAAPTDFELNAGTVALPIGVPQFDGVPNTRMDEGTILSLMPFARGAGQAVVDILRSWRSSRHKNSSRH